MIKKCVSKILTSVSFTGIAISNIKAAENKQKVHININGDVFHNNGDTAVNITGVKNFNALCNIIKGLGECVNHDDTSKKHNFNNFIDEYFVYSVTVGNSDENKLSDKFEIDLSTADADVVIELVPKRECIKFEYTGPAELAKADEDALLKTVIQGNQLKSISLGGVIDGDFGSSTLAGKTVKDCTDIIGKDVKVLDENNKIEFKIDSSKIVKGREKKVVCKFADNTKRKLVEGVDLEKLCAEFNGGGIKKDNLKLSDVRVSLNKCDIVNTNHDFFKNLNGVSIRKDGEHSNNANIITNEDPKSFSTAAFVVVDGIKKENINPIFLKKNFTVKFDNSGDTDKNVDDNILNGIEDVLDNEFEDKVDIKVKDITKIISDVRNLNEHDIIKATAFNDLSNITIEGVENKENGKLGYEDVVNSKDITVNLKEGVFADGIVKTVFNFKVNFNAVKKGGKDLNDTISGKINALITKLGVNNDKVLPIADFIEGVNDAFKNCFLENQSLAETDFDFSKCKKNQNDTSLNKSGTILAKGSIVSKLKDDCFETPAKPKGKTEDSSNGTGSGDNNGDTSKKGCCGSTKK